MVSEYPSVCFPPCRCLLMIYHMRVHLRQGITSVTVTTATVVPLFGSPLGPDWLLRDRRKPAACFGKVHEPAKVIDGGNDIETQGIEAVLGLESDGVKGTCPLVVEVERTRVGTAGNSDQHDYAGRAKREPVG